MRERTCDVAVIGAGTAGLAAYRSAADAGLDAVLIERGPGGTTCARVGCMPSKLLIAAASAAHAARSADTFGVRVGGVRVDGPAVLARVRAERDRFVGAVFESVAAIEPDRRISGAARFRDAHLLEVADESGQGERIGFRAAVIATGSSPTVPEPLRGLGHRLLTTDTLFEIADLPASLAVLGGGAVGIEIAQAMARLGVAVTLLDAGSTLAGLAHPDLVACASDIFADDFALHTGAELLGAEAEGDGVRLSWRGPDGRPGGVTVARVLAAAGRSPNIAALEPERAGLRMDEHGVPEHDARSLLCAGADVLVAGDANADRPVLHEASRQGAIAGANAAALVRGEALARPEPWPALAMVFTHPQTARVGEPYDPEAPDRIVGTMSFADQGRARAEGTNRGAARIWARPNGRLLGAELIGPAVEHLAHQLTYAIIDGLTAQDLLDRPVYHPTVEEGLGGALAEIARAAGAR